MSIVVDTNAGEDALYKALSSALGDTAVVRRRLDVGDVLLQHAAPEGEMAVIIERKTWLDLHKSLIDGHSTKACRIDVLGPTVGKKNFVDESFLLRLTA